MEAKLNKMPRVKKRGSNYLILEISFRHMLFIIIVWLEFTVTCLRIALHPEIIFGLLISYQNLHSAVFRHHICHELDITTSFHRCKKKGGFIYGFPTVSRPWFRKIQPLPFPRAFAIRSPSSLANRAPP